MKKIILSVAVATMALSTSAMAIDNVKANGSAKFIYQGSDDNTPGSKLLDQAGASAQAGVNLGMTADLSTDLKGGVSVQGVSTLGLENNLVGGTMATNGGLMQPGEAATDDQFWISEAYLTYTMGNTMAKVGLQELNTPMVFTEKWNVVSNTFQAVVLVNNDIKNVTLVGAFVGKGNAQNQGGGGQVVQYDGKFDSFHGGAYAAGAVAKVAGVNAQAWYYNADDVTNAGTTGLDAYWLEADTKVAGIFLGAQYAGTDLDNAGDLNAFAVKAAGDVMGAHLFAAYSQVDDANGLGALGFSNLATSDKTKLYTGTGSILADGAAIAIEDTKAWKIGAKGNVAGFGLGLEYTDADYGQFAANSNGELQVIQGFVSKKVGPIALKAMYTERETTTGAGVSSDFELFRLIASTKF